MALACSSDGAFLVLAYDLELFGGVVPHGSVVRDRMGSVPGLTGYFAQTGHINGRSSLPRACAASPRAARPVDAGSPAASKRAREVRGEAPVLSLDRPLHADRR